MPRNASGNYTLPLPAVIPNTIIESVWANTTLDDLANSVTDSLDRYGRGGMVAPFRIVDGTAASPALAFVAETGSGLFRESTGVIGMSVLGTKQQQWTTAGTSIFGDLTVTGTVTATGGITGGTSVSGGLTVDGGLVVNTGSININTAPSRIEWTPTTFIEYNPGFNGLMMASDGTVTLRSNNIALFFLSTGVIRPQLANTIELGSPTFTFGNGYFRDLNFSNQILGNSNAESYPLILANNAGPGIAIEFRSPTIRGHVGSGNTLFSGGSASDFGLRSNANLVFSPGGAGTVLATMNTVGYWGFGKTPTTFLAGSRALQVNSDTAGTTSYFDLWNGDVRNGSFFSDTSQIGIGSLVARPVNIVYNGNVKVTVNANGLGIGGAPGVSQPLYVNDPVDARAVLFCTGSGSGHGSSLIWYRNSVLQGSIGSEANRIGSLSANSLIHAVSALLIATGPSPSTTRMIFNTSGEVYPGVDNAQSLGVAGVRWSVVYAATGAINTSDAREKTPIVPLTPNEIAAAKDLAKEIGTFQYLAALDAKGADARYHVGMSVQRAIEVMESHGLVPTDYGFICHDSWPEQEKFHSATETEPAWTEIIPGGDRYGFRMDEFTSFLARGFEARISSLGA